MSDPPVLAVGSCTIDALYVVGGFPSPAEASPILEADVQLGGPIATAAVGLARLGVSVSVVDSFGADERRPQILAALASEGVDTSRVPAEPLANATRRTVVIVDQRTGERQFLYGPHEELDLAWDPVAATILEPGVPRMLLINESSGLGVAVARCCRALEVPIMLDAGWNQPNIEEAIALCDYPIVSSEFCRQWRPEASLEECAQELAQDARFAVVTLGAKGCLLAEGGERGERGERGAVQRFAALPTDVVDTTGAGDAFHAGVIYGLLSGAEPARCVHYGAAVASLAIGRLGATAGLPTSEAVDDLVQRSQPYRGGDTGAPKVSL